MLLMHVRTRKVHIASIADAVLCRCMTLDLLLLMREHTRVIINSSKSSCGAGR
jgi:hypothetical protein